MEYRVLGPVEVLADGRPVAIGGPKPRSLLVLLLLNAGRVVPTTQVIEALWGGRPPRSGATRVQGVVSQLRASLARVGVAGSPIATHPHGYLLTVGDDELDLEVFERRYGEGRSAAARGDLDAAASHVQAEALARDLPETALRAASRRPTTQPSAAPLSCAVAWVR
jgi:DNA-binding SARP family transcriptional activator